MVSPRILSLFMMVSGVAAFTVPSSPAKVECKALSMSKQTEEEEATSRRSFLGASCAIASSFLLTPSANAAQEPEFRQGIEVNAFNGLIFNYRGGEFGGLQSNEIDEPSVSYADFCQKLKDGQVEFVEFLAPDGDKAYATFKDAKAPIRIGEGYPIEQHDGYSSPAFAVRTVKNAGVPYKFTVPGLAKYSTKS